MKKILERILEVKGEQSTAAFARSLGLNQQTMDRYLKGREPPIGVIQKLCLVYELSANWLLGLPDNDGKASIHAPNNSGAIAIGGNAIYRNCMECPLLQAHLKRFSTPPKS